MSRTRVRQDASVAGSVRTNLGIVVNSSSYLERETCVDEVATGDGHPLTITKRKSYPPGGRFTGIDGGYTYENWFPDCLRDPLSYASHVPPVGRPTDAALATKLLKMTNPSRPVVDLPIFIAELRDLPSLVRKAGGGLIREIASANLKYQFAIRPLVSDLMSMLDFTQSIDARVKELEALRASGLRCKRRLWSDTVESSTSNIIGSSSPVYAGTRYDVKTITLYNTWGFVRWFPNPSVPFPPPGDETRKLARRAVLGLTVDLSTAWELIPFSWLIDWFSNVGDFLAAQRNIVECTHSTPLIMERRYSAVTFKRTYAAANAGRASPVHATKTLESKTRVSASASLSAYLPVLTNRQLSILGSLAVVRGSGRYPSPRTAR